MRGGTCWEALSNYTWADGQIDGCRCSIAANCMLDVVGVSATSLSELISCHVY